MKRFALLALVAAVPLLAGCRHYHHTVRHGGVYVPGASVHYHGEGCGHVYMDGCWVNPAVTVVHTHRTYGPRVVISPVFPHFWGHGRHFGPRIDHHRHR